MHAQQPAQQAFNQSYDLASHITYVSCTLILSMNEGMFRLKSTPNDRFLSNFIVAILYLLLQFLPDINRAVKYFFSYFFLLELTAMGFELQGSLFL